MRDEPLWSPDRQSLPALPISLFAAEASRRVGRSFDDYDSLHAWSVAEPGAFWDLVWDFCGVIGERGTRQMAEAAAMRENRFFPDARLNLAENLLRRMGADDSIVFSRRGQVERRLSWTSFPRWSRGCSMLCGRGVSRRTASRHAADMPKSIAIMLAAASLARSSPHARRFRRARRFGPFWADRAKTFLRRRRLLVQRQARRHGREGEGRRRQLTSAVRTVVIPYLGHAAEVCGGFFKRQVARHFHRGFSPAPARLRAGFRSITRSPFSSRPARPARPKCIVHGAGGTLLQHLKEHRLHCSLRAGEKLFYFTTLGWMMWNWLVSGLASGATLVLYDGSPFHPDGRALFDYAQASGLALFGTSAKFIDAVRKAGLRPRDTHDLSRLRMMTSTGSPLAPKICRFRLRLDQARLHLASISGGTDIVSCFVLGIPTSQSIAARSRPGSGWQSTSTMRRGNPVRGEKASSSAQNRLRRCR